MNFYDYNEIESSEEPANEVSLPVKPAPEPVGVSMCDRVNDLLESGGDISVSCTIEEFNEVFLKFKPERRACKLEVNWVDGVLHASARI